MAFIFGALPMLLLSPILAPLLVIVEAADRIWDRISSFFPHFYG